jgi:hypothetical protein
MKPIEIKSILVTPISRDAFAISWDFEPMLRRFSEFDCFLEKSEAPHDGFETISKINPEERYYVDSDIRIFKLWKKYYVRLKIVDKTSNEVSYSKTGTVEHPPSVEALELIRRTHITLRNRRYGNGVPCLVFIRKEGGQRCFECFDPIKKRSTKSNCVACYGTTYDQGFYSPIESFVGFGVDVKAMGISDIGNMVQSGNRAIMSNHPIVKPGDIVIDSRLNRIWSIQDVQNVERRRHVVKQILTLSEEERTSVLFELMRRVD